MLSNDEVRDLIGMHSDLPDLWDLAHGSWEQCSGTSRFTGEAAQQDLVQGIRELTDRPIAGVGRFTSPDVMVKQLKSGVLDFIGCARPSIADPWLPRKIDEGRVEDIRECIGCNICVTGDMTMSLSRCTQNPSFMEEWRKGWHPETMNAKGDSNSVLVVGAGPAGLEAALSLGRRGYQVSLAEKNTVLGGRVTQESTLPGLSAWARVRDYREYQISQMDNVDVYLDNDINAADILEFDADHVAIATGSSWRNDGVARQHVLPIEIHGNMPLFTPDNIMNGAKPSGRVVVFDDDHYYMGSVIAERLIEMGCTVTLVTPSAYVSEWTLNTLEQGFIATRMLELGVALKLNTSVACVASDSVQLQCVYSGKTTAMQADGVVMVTAKEPIRDLWDALQAVKEQWGDHGIKSIKLIGDAEAPAPIAWATYAGHRFARELDAVPLGDALPFKREVTQLLSI